MQEDQVPRDVLEDIVKRSCAAFRSEEVTPLIKVDGHYILVSDVVVAAEGILMLCMYGWISAARHLCTMCTSGF